MLVPQFAVLWSTVALASALPRSPDSTPREQQVFEYFPDFRYVDPMENPTFMTAECSSEGVFPHPHNCTWFYRCHDRTGHGFFTTNWFYCEPGTEFDDDLDQCIPKSGKCGDGEDTYFCKTLQSSCRSCNGQQLCEFKECFNGGRDAGIQRICKQGQMFDGQSQSCVEVSGCPPVASPPGAGECPLNPMRPRTKWTDDNSGCSVYTGCRAGRNYQETLCMRFYDCQQGTAVTRTCPEGYFFSQKWELCIKPPQTQGDCVTPLPPPPRCIRSQAVGQECQEQSGCFNGRPGRTTKNLCAHYTCSETGSTKFYCNGQGSSYSFSPDTKTCVTNLVECPTPQCLPENAVRWESCNIETGYRYPSAQKISELLCQEYSCSTTSPLRPCGPGQLFEPDSKTCLPELSPIPPPPPPPPQSRCTANLATSWESCTTVSGCTDLGTEMEIEECQVFKCSANGEASFCQNGQVFSPTMLACVNPLSDCPCTVERAKFWGDCNDVTGCTADSQSERTEKQCKHYSCSITGQQFRCEGGQVFSPDTRSCVEPLNVATCPCTPERAQFWGDCNDVTGCSSDNQLERTEKQCQHYSCSISGQEIRCGGGQVFSPDSRSCVEPLNVATCLCTADRAQFWGDCNDVTGCSSDNQSERTEKQCQHYSCSITGRELRCEGGQVFSPDTRSCVEPLNVATCPCTADLAQFWGDCNDVTGCSADNQSERTEKQCQHYSCSITGQEFRCEGGQVFSPDTRSCVEPLNVATCPCTADRAQFWGDCNDVKGCSSDNQSERTEKQCHHYSCSITGQEFRCEGEKVFSPDTRSCVEPLNVATCPCTVDRAQFWGDCDDVTGCSSDNQEERTEKQCQYYSCSIRGQEFRCDGGKVFSPDTRSCVEPLNVATCPCTIDRAKFWGDCNDVTGCSSDIELERTEKQCKHYSCSVNGQEFRCEGEKVFSENTRSCVKPLTSDACPISPDNCTPDKAKKWTTCSVKCDTEGNEVEVCYFFACSETINRSNRVPCNALYTEMFDPKTKTCYPKLNDCPKAASSGVRDGCSPNRAALWYDCSINKACIDDRYPQQQQKLCGQYSCEGEKIECGNGQMYDSEKSACVTPLTGKYCLDGSLNNRQQPKVTFKSWNNQWN